MQPQRIEDGRTYTFTIIADSASQGDNRFELSMAGEVSTGVANLNSNTGLKVSITPNPATDQMTISYTASQSNNTSVRIMNMAGQTVIKMELGKQLSGSVNIPLNNVASGVYIVEFTSGNQITTQRLVKQ
jgi:hypothetical protein